jgi:N4-(beta-N-acetylglucosaminyl)-L-asparaginase
MIDRRKFLKAGMLGSASLLLRENAFANKSVFSPTVLSTWSSNVKANNVAWSVLQNNGRALDAIENGIRITEADPTDNSVGYGGLPDRDGIVSLDACVMDEFGNCGAVMALEQIMHPISVARLVMEKTKHVQLAGEGALQFALAQNFKKQNLLTTESERAWKEWLKTSGYIPDKKEELIRQNEKEKNHDTIGMVALDAKQNLSGGCSTSGLSFKMHGRIGDSPIIGAGLFVDNVVGAATATGIGEEVIKICGTHTIVELMRQGIEPEQACKQAIERITKRHGANAKNFQVGFIALRRDGSYGGFSIVKGFDFVVTTKEGTRVVQSKSLF